MFEPWPIWVPIAVLPLIAMPLAAWWLWRTQRRQTKRRAVALGGFVLSCIVSLPFLVSARVAMKGQFEQPGIWLALALYALGLQAIILTLVGVVSVVGRRKDRRLARKAPEGNGGRGPDDRPEQGDASTRG